MAWLCLQQISLLKLDIGILKWNFYLHVAFIPACTLRQRGKTLQMKTPFVDRLCLLKRYITTRESKRILAQKRNQIACDSRCVCCPFTNYLQTSSHVCCIILRNTKYINTVRDNIFILRSVHKWSKESESIILGWVKPQPSTCSASGVS